MKTHKVLDLHYHEDEGQACFDGTQKECEEFAATQSPQFMYKVIPMTKEEIENHPDNLPLRLIKIEKAGEFPIMADVVFRKRSEQCINLYIVNEDKTEQYICFFNKESAYAKNLESRFNVQFSKLF